jgi:membrane-bound metal-dependent hydrolase YbcI (DUF457 family)
MNKGGHLIVGFVTGIIFIIVTHYFIGWFDYNLKNIYIYTIIIALYSLLPDSDHRNSFISFVFIGASIIGLIIGYNLDNNLILYSSFGLLIVTFVAWLSGHRGIVHSISFAILASAPLIYFFDYKMALLALICFYSHLCADESWLKFI